MTAYRRRNLRLPEYDYSTPGTYFITICVQNRACVFGDAVDGGMVLNEVGSMVDGWWMETYQRFKGAESDVYVIMPNHLHALVRIGWSEGSAEESRQGKLHLPGEFASPSNDGSAPPSRHGGLRLQGGEAVSVPGGGDSVESRQDDEAVSLGKVVQWFKSATTTAYSRHVASDGWPRFPVRLWQQNYYEHIIRNEPELGRARAYILGNPGKWSEDAEYRPFCPGFS